MFKLLSSTSSPLISNKAISLFIESLNSKEPRKSISSASSLKKSSLVSTEELAGKEALSRQYVQDNTKRPTSTIKAGSSGAQITPKSGIAAPSSRTGIPGLLHICLRFHLRNKPRKVRYESTQERLRTSKRLVVTE